MPPLERLAAVEDDFLVDREFLEPPTLHLDRIWADEPDRSDEGVGDVLVGDEAADDGPVIGLGLRVQVGHVEFDVIVAQGPEHELLLHEMLRHADDGRARGRIRLGHGRTGA